MKITVIEIINNNNNWEWQKIVKTDEVDMNEARKEALIEYNGFDFEEDKEYIEANYLDDTKISNIEI